MKTTAFSTSQPEWNIGVKPPGQPLSAAFFERDAQLVAIDLLGKLLCHRVGKLWLTAKIIETEAYYRKEKASHASLGLTEKRRALFMPPGTIYMYYARGGDSFNLSCGEPGDAVLIKGAIPWLESPHAEVMIREMAARTPLPSGKPRPHHRLCSGQTLLCRALGLRVPQWDRQSLDPERLTVVSHGEPPEKIIRTTRLGIPQGRDGHLPLRFVDFSNAASATKNPLTARKTASPVFEVLTLDNLKARLHPIGQITAE